jgi:hypothetical protein
MDNNNYQIYNTQMYDYHTLNVKCYNATLEQIKNVFNNAFEKYKLNHNKNIECSFYYNLILNKEGVSYGIAFVYVSNKEVYNMILGKNPDGTERLKHNKKLKAKKSNQSINWGDSSDDEEIIDTIILEPLIVLEPIQLNDEQKPYYIEPVVNLVINRALIYKLEDKYIHNILKTKKIPHWITHLMIKKLFSPFASDNTTKHSRIIKGKKITDTYPFVNINKDGICFIIYDVKTNDAQFALHMMKKTTITQDNKTITLVFNHSYNLVNTSTNKNFSNYVDDNKFISLQIDN